MKNLLQKLEKNALEKISTVMLKQGRIAVACSGGSDSVFLLLAALKIIPKDRLLVLHFNHAVRKNADTDETFVGKLCEKLGVECIIKKRKGTLKKVSEESLRNARMEFFKESAKENNILLILQGHIKNDIAETILMRLARGSSIDGLCAPRPVSETQGLCFARPLLSLEKKEIQAFLKKSKQAWREDESNAKDDFTRNKMRLRIIPEIEKSQNRDFLESAARTRALLEEDAVLIAEILKKHCKRTAPSAFTMDSFAVKHPSLMRRCVQTLLSENSMKLRAREVDKFLADAFAGNDAQSSLNGAVLAYNAKRRELSLSKSLNPQAFCVDLKLGKNILPNGSAIVLEKIKADKNLFDLFKGAKIDEKQNAYIACSQTGFCARAINSKDAYAPIGSKNSRLVKEMMSARKTDILKRKRLPLVCLKDGNPVWAPTLAPSEAAKVEKGKSAIRLTYIEQA